MNVQVRSKVWLEVNGAPLLGDGREKLLRLIDRTGSISSAAKEMGLTYRKAWSHLKNMEQALEIQLVLRRTGGASGGSSTLTPEATSLLKKF